MKRLTTDIKATYLISAQNQSHNTNAVNLQLKLKEKKITSLRIGFLEVLSQTKFSRQAFERRKN